MCFLVRGVFMVGVVVEVGVIDGILGYFLEVFQLYCFCEPIFIEYLVGC
jgi:hypothetical protein